MVALRCKSRNTYGQERHQLLNRHQINRPIDPQRGACAVAKVGWYEAILKYPTCEGEDMKLCPQCDSGYPDSHATCPTHGVVLSEIRDLRPGMVIHQSYRIVRKLGQGGMGSVYLAKHTLMDEPLALKFLSSELSRDQAFANRFLREVRTLRQVRHRNVVDAGNLEPAEDGTLFFSMEFVDGPDLRGLMHGTAGPFPVKLALEIACGIAEGLGAAHAKGMVHRDIKPENNFLTHISARGNGRKTKYWGRSKLAATIAGTPRLGSLWMDHRLPESGPPPPICRPLA